MTTYLQQALLDDSVDAVCSRIVLGSYPHAIYRKAVKAKAWACVQWIAEHHCTSLSAWDWHALASNEKVQLDAAIVQLAHMHGIMGLSHRIWKNSGIAWEKAGVELPTCFYTAMWKIPSASFSARAQLMALGKMHRFAPIEAWLASKNAPSENEIATVFKQLWECALLYFDNVLLAWLNPRTPRETVMSHLYNCITSKGLALPSILAKRLNYRRWDIDMFFDNSLHCIGMTIDEFCQYTALYSEQRLQRIWQMLSMSKRISSEWRIFFSSKSIFPVDKNSSQQLIFVLTGLFPNDEALRMRYLDSSNRAQSLPQVNLVDLL